MKYIYSQLVMSSQCHKTNYELLGYSCRHMYILEGFADDWIRQREEGLPKRYGCPICDTDEEPSDDAFMRRVSKDIEDLKYPDIIDEVSRDFLECNGIRECDYYTGPEPGSQRRDLKYPDIIDKWLDLALVSLLVIILALLALFG